MADVPTTIRSMVSRAFSLAEKELSVLNELHADVQAAVLHMTAADPGIDALLKRAYAYAVLPSVGKASAVIGGAFGKGEVFKGGELVGYCAVAQLTIGVQIGGQTFSEIVAFENKPAFERFKSGRYAFAANASAVLVKAGAATSVNYEKGAAVLIHSDGGMMLEAAIGGQKFFFKPGVLGRGKTAKPQASNDAEKTATSTRTKAGNQSGGARSKAKPARSKPSRKPTRRRTTASVIGRAAGTKARSAQRKRSKPVTR